MKRKEKKTNVQIMQEEKKAEVKYLLKITEEFNENDLHKAFKEGRSYREGFTPSTELCKDVQGNIIGDCTKISKDGRNILNVY